jgi:transposase
LAEKEALLIERDRVIAVRDAELYAKTLQIEHLKAQLAVLRRARFGRSSEKLDREIEQLELILGELEEGVAENSERAARAPPDAERGERAKRQDRKPLGRKPLPDHVPRERVLHEAPPACASCSGTVLRKIGEDVTEVLEYVPSFFKVVEHVRPKLSCRACAAIMQTPLPSFPIERGRAGAGLLAHVIVSKYADALPLHRQSLIYERAGVELDRSTMADWVGSMAALIDPLYEAIGTHVRRGAVLFADDTTVPVLAPGKGRTETGRLWVVVRDEGSYGVARHRRRPFTATRAIARRNKPKRCWGCVAASCMRMATPASTGSMRSIPSAESRVWSRLHVGATRAARFTTCMSKPAPRWRRRRWSG